MSIRLEVPVEITVQAVEVVSEIGSEERAILSLQNLPPLIVTLLLPPTYPLRASPLLVHLHSTNGWLTASETNRIHESLSDMWQEDVETGTSTGSLWRSCEWIRNGSFLQSTASGNIRYVCRNFTARTLTYIP